MFNCLLFLFSLCLFSPTASSIHTSCHDSEHHALLQFKKSLLINDSAPSEPSAYSKVQHWGEENDDCCAWDGVECNNNTGHVIALDLSSSFLYGSIESDSTLFHLIHLRRLNLSNNDFNHSQIPYGIANLSMLSLLDLSSSAFSGQIPSEILKLSKLVILALSWNDLELQSPRLRSFVEKLTNLEELHLSGVKISSTVPHNLGNLSSLVHLSMEYCRLVGELPATIFQLPNLRVLALSYNPYLTGKLPEFNRSSLVEILMLANTSFSGEIPESIGTLNLLSYFDISLCQFSGKIPSSLANLTQLTHLSLASYGIFVPGSNINSFSPGTLSWLGKQTKLTKLDLSGANLNGEIPNSLENLTQLNYLWLFGNQLIGAIPYWLGNLSQLTSLNLGLNELQGHIPQSIFNLVNLTTLYLESNELNGTLKLDSFLYLKNLTYLNLSYNNLSMLITNITINGTLPQFKLLGLGDCNFLEFPNFLHQQDELEFLQLSRNKIHGQIPKWVWERSKESLLFLILSDNFLTGFDQPISSMTNLRVLVLDSNKLQGSIPIPPLSILSYSVSNTSLTGEFSPLLCNLPSLAFLDLSYKNLSGMLPQCLVNLSQSLEVLDLQNNNFNGSIPQLCKKRSPLRMIDFNQNQFQGKLPRSLASCKMFKILSVGNNQLNDTFPFWLGKLLELRILILRGNQFHGVIKDQIRREHEFPKLHIIDISFNRFSGDLPSHLFQYWIAMRVINASHLRYLQAKISMNSFSTPFLYSVKITSKATERDYKRIPDFLAIIDFSSNSFEGCIPQNIGNLKALSLLNLSNNALWCHIPPSLGNLSNLDSLDLSHNNLSGEIPTELLQLTFLGFLDFSQNNLTGQIPQGKQFATFENSSFGSNPGLYGKPLSKPCRSSPVSPTEIDDEGHESLLEFDRKIILIGFGGGLVNGLAIGYMYNPWWLKKYMIRRMQQKRRHARRKPRN